MLNHARQIKILWKQKTRFGHWQNVPRVYGCGKHDCTLLPFGNTIRCRRNEQHEQTSSLLTLNHESFNIGQSAFVQCVGSGSSLRTHINEPKSLAARLSSCVFSEGVAGADFGEDLRKQSGGSTGESKQAPATKSRAEANPLGSKLGLSAGASPLTAVPLAMAAVPRGVPQPQGQGRGRGRGRGRGLHAAVPGRRGRPLYSPLMQVG